MQENITQWLKPVVFVVCAIYVLLVFPAFSPKSVSVSVVVNTLSVQDTLPYPTAIQQVILDNTKPVVHKTLPVCKASYGFSNSYATSENYDVRLTSDTPYITHLKRVSELITIKTVSVCQGEGYFAANKPRFVSGVFRDTLSTMNGCDSIVVTNLSVIHCKYSE